MQTLSSEQVQQFVADGFLILRNCFSREAAAPYLADVWQEIGYDPNDRSTWEKPLVFHYPQKDTSLRELSPLLWNAICELSGGEERLTSRDSFIGQWIINFYRGGDEQWIEPGPQTQGWHVDGNFFRHFLDSPEQGLLVVPLFSDIQPRGGGTVFAPDSVPVVSRFLAAHPEGVLPVGIPNGEFLAQCKDFREITGAVGDVVIFHPFMMHSFAQNHRTEPRFITNVCVKLNEPMRFDGAAQHSPVEQAILHGLGKTELDFKIAGKRERIET